MRIFRLNSAFYGLIFGSVLIVTGCGEEKSAPPQKTIEQTQAEKIAEEQRVKEYEEQLAKLETELQKATPEKIKSILSSCQSSVLELAESRNTSPFGVFLVDEYSADVYQAGAYVGGGNVSSESERVKRFIKARKDGEKDLRYALDLSYTVMFTRDSFSGPQKEPRRYSCQVEPGLTVRAF